MLPVVGVIIVGGEIVSSGIWKLTQLGRKRAGSIYSSEASDSVMSYLYENKTASIEELSNVTRKPTAEVRSYLRKLEREGLAEQLGGA